MIKEINTPVGKILVVEVDKDANGIEIIKFGNSPHSLAYSVNGIPKDVWLNPKIASKIIGTIHRENGEVLFSFDPSEYCEHDYIMPSGLDSAILVYKIGDVEWTESAKEKFISLLQSNGIYFEDNKKYVIIKANE